MTSNTSRPISVGDINLQHEMHDVDGEYVSMCTSSEHLGHEGNLLR
ncbi:MAG TPA: hypothetical protein VLA72_22115 [Anaerolineales bacterium]|nr:hypothetical protein [Anaerolineales bacterium]